MNFPSSDKVKIFLPILLFAVFAFLCGYRLGFPPEKVYDEVYHVTTAQQFVGLNGFLDTAHPPLGKVWIASSIWLMGDHPWAWRLASFLSGLGTLAVTFYLAKKLTGDFFLAFLASFLLAFDCASLAVARNAMIHAPMLFFMMLSLLAVVPYGVEGLPARRRSFFASGILWGLALGTRWIAIGISGVLFLLIYWGWKEEENKAGFWRDFILFFVIPAGWAYTAAYTVLPLVKGYQWKDVWHHQKHMLSYHEHLKAKHPYGSRWWGWPVLLRPIWFYFKRKQGLVFGTICIGNPVIFWTMPLAIGFSIWELMKEKSRIAAFILAGFFGQWLIYIFISRVTFFHYIYPMLPFTALAVAYALREIWRGGKAGRVFVAAYLVSAGLMFIYWYPLLTAFPVTEAFFRHHLWFKAWI